MNSAEAYAKWKYSCAPRNLQGQGSNSVPFGYEMMAAKIGCNNWLQQQPNREPKDSSAVVPCITAMAQGLPCVHRRSNNAL